MALFYIPDLTADLLTLPPDESRHCVRVLRLAAGDAISVADGKGTLCRCRIVSPDPSACMAEVVERIQHYGRRSFRLHLAVAPTKNAARIEWLVEKAVEIGVDEITPIICDHSERIAQKTERLEKIAVSAMKQSLKAYLPTIHPALPLRRFIQQPHTGTRLVCYCEGDLRTPLRDAYHAGHDAVIVIGPEGDFSPEEIKTALDNGFQAVTLGDSRLRTETAALYAITALNFMNT